MNIYYADAGKVLRLQNGLAILWVTINSLWLSHGTLQKTLRQAL